MCVCVSGLRIWQGGQSPWLAYPTSCSISPSFIPFVDLIVGNVELAIQREKKTETVSDCLFQHTNAPCTRNNVEKTPAVVLAGVKFANYMFSLLKRFPTVHFEGCVLCVYITVCVCVCVCVRYGNIWRGTGERFASSCGL